jgi:F-type H+-transporting ATPase subunit a
MLRFAVAIAPMAVDGDGAEGTSADASGGIWSWLFHTDGFHPPSVMDFFPDAFLFEGTLFEVNRVTVIRMLAAIVLVSTFAIVAQRARVVPVRGQAAAEMLLDFVRVQIVEEVMGKERARRFVPFLTTLFLAIIFFNLTGVIPFLNLAATSLIGLPIVMALWVYVLYLGVGIKKHGLGGYLKTSLFPSGVPKVIYLLLTPIEALQVFVLRPATLALRLAANMMAGHLLLALCFAATQYFVFAASGAFKGFGALTLAGAIAFTLFEIFVALLQAYVFVMLSAVYLNMALEDEH